MKGVGPSFDGSYVVSAVPDVDTFSYNVNKNTNDVPTAGTSSRSSVAVARVPFAIKKVRNATEGASYPASITAIELAEIKVPPTSSVDAISIKDLRKFVPTSGGMHVYNSTSGATFPGALNPTSGMLRYDVSNNTLQVYDSTASAFRTLYTNSGAGEVFPRLGTSATQAATGNHTHVVNQFGVDYGTIYTSSYIDATIPANTTTLDASWSGKSAAGDVFITPASGRVIVNMSARLATYNSGKVTILSVRIGTGGTINGGTDILNESTSGKNSLRLEGGSSENTLVRFGTSFVLNLTGNTTYNACFYYYNTDTIAVPVDDAYIEFVPIP